MPIIRLADQSPGNIGNLMISICSYPRNIGKPIFSTFYYAGNIGNGSLHYSQNPGNIGNLTFVDFCDFYKKDARRNFTQNPPINEPRSLI